MVWSWFLGFWFASNFLFAGFRWDGKLRLQTKNRCFESLPLYVEEARRLYKSFRLVSAHRKKLWFLCHLHGVMHGLLWVTPALLPKLSLCVLYFSMSLQAIPIYWTQALLWFVAKLGIRGTLGVFLRKQLPFNWIASRRGRGFPPWKKIPETVLLARSMVVAGLFCAK